MPEAPTTVVFDVGNVLVRWKPEEFYLSVLKDPARMRWYLDNVHTVAWNHDLDRGVMEWDRLFDERTAAFPDWEEPLRAYQTRWFDTLREPVEPNVALLRRLKDEGVPVYAVTNFNGYTFRTLREQYYDFLNLFDGAVVSGDEKLLKPEPAIYRLLNSRYGLALENCVFIDDSAANVAGAQAEGMHGIRFTEPMNLAAELRKIGFVQV